ncbi:DUF1465 family protein [Sinorhizobium meliloti]|nr:DUF1465 family protein [Sinorhizobium meliloti]
MSAESILIFEGNSIAMRHLRAESFGELYRSVMKLVEDLAEYLDVTGRQQSRSLHPPAAREYAALSRQLTTGALRVASALLVLKSVRDGSTPFNSGMADIRKKEMAEPPGSFSGSRDGLPTELLELSTRCDCVRLEVKRLVDHLCDEGKSGKNPVHAALGLITSVFGNA